MPQESRKKIEAAFEAPFKRLSFGLAALVLVWGGPVEAQVFKLCVNGNNSNVKAIPADQDCSDLSGPFQEFAVSDGDWLGQGSGVLQTESKNVNVAIGQDSATARLDVRGSLTESAGAFEIDSPFSNSPALASVTNGRGPAVSGVANGRGAAISGLVTGPNSAAPALRATHAGGRRAGEFEGEVRITRNANQLVLRDSDDAFKTWALTSDQATSGIGFWENGQNSRFIVAEGGNVGIGDPNPQSLLSVSNDQLNTAGSFRNTNAANNQPAVAARTTGNGPAVFGRILNPDSTDATVFAVHDGGGLAGRFVGQLLVTRGNHQIRIRDEDNASKTWTLTSHQATSGIGFWENGETGRFVVASGGNVGIGTTQPDTRLDINGNNAASADLRITDGAFARAELIATGTGTAAPVGQDVKLTVQARASSPTVRRAEIGTRSNHDLIFFTNLANRLILGADGSVCLGAC